jgi:NADH-quinone oxidoreductase subunit N
MNEFLALMKSELVLTGLLVLLLVWRIAGPVANGRLFWLVNAVLACGLVAGMAGMPSGQLFGGMYYTTPFLALQKGILLLGLLVISLSSWEWMKDHPHLPEFYMLLVSALLGMFFMLSSGNLLMFYLSLELSTLPMAALCNFDLERKRSSEAALKMILSSAFSSGLLLLGISLVYGTAGSLSFTALPAMLDGSALQVAALVLLFTGFAFKLSVVPFHLWTADVYEGSPVAVTSFLSVISKGSVAFVLVAVLYKVFGPLYKAWYPVLYITSVATMVTGNLLALRQHNIKRFLAFSSIAQVGFILVGMSGAGMGAGAVTYFILVYLFSNLGAFGVVGLVSAVAGKENIADYNGFYRTNPWLAWVLTISLFSLAGIPPTAGFFGKFFLLASGASAGNYTWIALAAGNMVLALYYYLKVVRAMFMEKNDAPIEKIGGGMPVHLALAFCLAGMVLAGVFSGIYEYIHSMSQY